MSERALRLVGIATVALFVVMLVSASSALAVTQPTFTRADFTVGNGPTNAIATDVNGDGRPDLVVPNSNDSNVSIMLGNGAGGFGSQTTYSVARGPIFVAAGDVNGDGRPDLAVACEDGNAVSVLLGNGSGGFSPGVTLDTSSPVTSQIADVNGDGIPDIVVSSFAGGNVGVFLGKGGGTFGAETGILPTGGDGPHGHIAYLNGDGVPDVATANYFDDSVSVAMGTGAGTFSTVTTYPAGSGPVGIDFGDFNRDGARDIAVSDLAGSSVRIFQGNGAGSFTPVGGPDVALYPNSLVVADLNGDGAPDIATSNGQGQNLASVLLNNGSGGFSRSADISVGPSPWGITSSDVNGDGRPDLIVSNAGSDTVSVLLNTTAGGGGGGGGGGTTPPTTLISGVPPSWAKGPVTFSLSATDPDYPTGIKTYCKVGAGSEYLYSAPVSVTAEGSTIVAYRSTDTAGNAETTKTATVMIDNTAPSVAGSATTQPSAAGWYNTDVTVHFSATDALSGVAAVSPDALVTTEGKNQSVSGSATDTVGNRGVLTVGGISIDKTPPVTTDDHVDVYSGTAAVHFAASDALSGVAFTRWNLDGIPGIGGAVTTSVVGTHTLSYASVDQAANAEATKTVDFEVYPAVATRLSAVSMSASAPKHGKKITFNSTMSPSSGATLGSTRLMLFRLETKTVVQTVHGRRRKVKVSYWHLRVNVRMSGSSSGRLSVTTKLPKSGYWKAQAFYTGPFGYLPSSSPSRGFKVK